MKRLILLGLNEVNFDVVQKYIEISPEKYPALKFILRGCKVYTNAEAAYKNLEPWIQWPSIHTGLTYEEHKIFRLGDVVHSTAPQVFEILEQNGVCVGVISAMNADNRLKSAAYFIPDPWTKTSTDGSFYSSLLSEAVVQMVNDNAKSKITPKSLVVLLLSLIRFAKIKHYKTYSNLAFFSFKAPWRKALFFDLLLHDIHLGLFSSRMPQFSTLFLNAGAHIQHHYLFNSEPIKNLTALRNPKWYVRNNQDPVAEMLSVYDRILDEYLSLENTELMVVTGLSQKPYDLIKFYYRLKNHEKFLRKVGIRFRVVVPRMTRDFLVEFDTKDEAAMAKEKLESIFIKNSSEPLFGKIDNRGTSLFVTLTYPGEIQENDQVIVDGDVLKIKKYVSFVAIKNGMHQDKGFAFFSEGAAQFAPKSNLHVKEIFGSILGYFGVAN